MNRRYFRVYKICWNPEKVSIPTWMKSSVEKLPTEQNFILLEECEDVEKKLKETLCEYFGYKVDSLEYTELTKEEAENAALLLLIGAI